MPRKVLKKMRKPIPRKGPDSLSRRRLLTGAAGMAGIATLGASSAVLAQDQPLQEGPRVMGAGADDLGERSSYEQLSRAAIAEYPNGMLGSLTPLADLEGTITPSDLHYEIHHHGVPEIDPAEHRLLVHGMVENPTVYTMADIKRFPSVSRTSFLECSGNSLSFFFGPTEEDTAQGIAGLASCSEWVGVPLTRIFREVGVSPEATWVLFEGADAGRNHRSWPIEKLWHSDAMLAYGQNGEALRPPQGYPLRLIVPGSEGNANVKWLRRIEFSDQPGHSEKETAQYSDIRTDADGNLVANEFTFAMDAKSIITTPSGGQTVSGPGAWEIRGLAWSGRGKIAKVEVSTDNGQTWHLASLDGPVLSQAFTRFRYLWNWDGNERIIMSRAIDETGYIQPTREELLSWGRPPITYYHTNAIFAWKVAPDGAVTSGNVA